MTTLVSPVARRVAGIFSPTVCTLSVVAIKDPDRTSLALPLPDVVLVVLEHAVKASLIDTALDALVRGWGADCGQVGGDCVWRLRRQRAQCHWVGRS